MTKYSNWGSDEKHFVNTHLGKYLPDESFVCKKHLLEANRHHNDDTFTPKWKRKLVSPKCCIHPQCQDRFHEKLMKPAFATITAIKTHLGVQVVDDAPFLLCSPCYSKVYHHFNSPSRCSSCGATSKQGQKFIRHCPNPALVSQYLTDTIGTEINIGPSDRICTSCYNTHSCIIKSIQCQLSRTDEMLEKEIETWEATIRRQDENTLTNSILTSVIFVAQFLLSQKAVLLPWVCQVFLETYGIQDEDVKSIDLDEEERKILFSSQWLLEHLIVHLHPYMMHKCVHMRFGTVLYRRGADLLVSLSWALSSSEFGRSFQPSKRDGKSHNNDPNTETTLKELVL